MINGLGVLGWGVGGIEAEAAMLGQPVSMLVPQVVGFKLTGKLREGATATDLVLTVTEMLRKHGVVGKFVEFYGAGISELSLADRATIGNMAPEYGATCGIFPVDAETLRYLRLTGRSEEQIALVEAYYKEQGLFHTPDAPEAEYSATLALDLATVEPSVAGPKRPQDRVRLQRCRRKLQEAAADAAGAARQQSAERQVSRWEGEGGHPAANGSAVRTEHAEPGMRLSVTGALRRRSGQVSGPWLDRDCGDHQLHEYVESIGDAGRRAAGEESGREGTERAAVGEDFARAGIARGDRLLREVRLLPYLDKLRFNVVGYGCTTCIGNSGPLPTDVSKSIEEHGLVAVSVLSGNRNFEGRINSDVRANYLMSPPLVVAYALAGRIDHDFDNEPLGKEQGQDSQSICATSGRRSRKYPRRIASVDRLRDVPQAVRDCDRWRSNWQNLKFPYGRHLRVGAGFHLHPESAVLRRHAEGAGTGAGYPRRARAGGAGRSRDHRPYFACGIDQAERPGRQISDRAWREAGGLQHLRLAPRQP